ncbi:MAG: ATP-binding protein [Dehalococcoidia bacterium]
MSSVGLQGRITLLVGLTVAAVVAVLVYLGASAVDETEEKAQREQLAVTAQTVADHVDDVLVRTAGREEHLAQMVANAWSRGETQLTNLLDAYPRLLFESELYLLRPQGELVWSMRPGNPIPGGLSSEPLVTDAVESLQSAVGPCGVSTTQDRSRACFASPVLVEDDKAAGVLLAQIDLTRPDLNLFSLKRLGESVRIELIGADGVILASSEPVAGETSAHADAVAALSSQSGTGDAVHRQLVEGTQSSHTYGYAPISKVPGWGVVVEPKDGGVLAVSGDAQERLFLFGLAALAVGMAVVWLGARRLLRPMRAVAAKAALVVEGDLSAPLAEARRDEVGDIANALESLHVNLKAARDEAQQANHVRRLSATRGRLLDGLFARQEEERQRIAYELHEGTVQSVAALALTLDSLKNELATANHTTRDRLSRVRTMALALMQDLRRLAVDLRPSILDHLGLGPALKSYAESRLSQKGVHVRVDASEMELRPSTLLESSMYRVAQEAIDNVAIHAEARAADITLKSDGAVLTLVVKDDGKGFEPAELLADPDAVRGLGILSMQERVAFVGGTFSVESAPGKGTLIRAEIPLEERGKEQ